MNLVELFERLFNEIPDRIHLSNEDLIGKNFIAEKWDITRYEKPFYNKDMNDYIGKEGRILDYSNLFYRVSFFDGQVWAYPKEVVENQINGI